MTREAIAGRLERKMPLVWSGSDRNRLLSLPVLFFSSITFVLDANVFTSKLSTMHRSEVQLAILAEKYTLSVTNTVLYF